MASIDWDVLKDRSVLITGGASGLGEATTRKFVEHGAYVTIADVQDEPGKKLSEELGDRTTFVHCNTTDWESSAAAFKHAANFAPSKTIDIVIPYAGVDGERRGLVDLVLDQPAPSLDNDPTPSRPAHRAIDVNLIGEYISTYLALHYFRLPPANGQQSFKKSLILISSMTAYMDLPYNTVSSSSYLEPVLANVSLTSDRRGMQRRNMACAACSEVSDLSPARSMPESTTLLRGTF